ncbi:LysM peptidoglycan-binding domain-containing protein [Enterococcus sp. AZ126]|uniref:LysM peptidoglycan-binding domain-containing protein n=1 Tax=Enterococcus sp. AZ126 TaxID=2774635 RepID=UPI003F23481F
MEEEYSRRKQQRPTSTSNKTILIVILLLIINTFVLAILLFLNVQATSKQETRLENIEKQVSLLDKEKKTNNSATSTDSTKQNDSISESSTKISSSNDTSSTIESSKQAVQTTPSSENNEDATEPTTAHAATTYTVQSGDTLSAIAEKNNLSLQDLMTKNSLTDSTVYIGQVLSLQ